MAFPMLPLPGVKKPPTPLELARRYNSTFAKVPSPVNPHHYDTKLIFEFLLERGSFLEICDRVFGPLMLDSAKQGEMNKCWMDLADDPKRTDFADALFELLSPSGHLSRIMQHVSAPPVDFVSSLQSHWKDAGNHDREDAAPFTDPHYVPLTLLCHYTWQLMSETADTDLTTLSQDSVPSALLVPFWRPPLTAKSIPGSGQTLTALPSSMLAYFVIRMLQFLSNRSQPLGNTLMTAGPTKSAAPNASASVADHLKYWWSIVDRRVMQLFSPSLFSAPVVQLPFFNRLFTAYLQHFAPPAKIRPLTQRQPYFEIQWDDKQVIAALLLHAPIHMWWQRERAPETEHRRTPTERPSQMATQLMSLPYLRKMWEAVSSESDVTTGFRRRPVHQEKVATAAACLTDSKQFLYKQCIVSLRQVLISIGRFPNCPRHHIMEIMQLWTALLKTEVTDGNDGHSWHLKRYEAMSVVLSDFFNFSQTIDLMSKADREILTAFAAILRHIRANCLGWLQQVSSLLDREPHNPLLQAIAENQVLVWEEPDRASTVAGNIVNVCGDDMAERAVATFYSAQKRLDMVAAAQGSDEVQALGDILHNLEKLLPTVTRKSVSRQSSTSNVILSSSVSHHRAFDNHRSGQLLEDEARHAYLVGKSRGYAFLHDDVKFRVRSHHGEAPLASDEIPLLVTITSVLDRGINYVAGYLRKESCIPRCDKGHRLYICEEDTACSFHPAQPAIWYCRPCNVSYGAECKGPLIDQNGQCLTRRVGKPCVCKRCKTVVHGHEMHLELTEGFQLCPQCAVVPPRISVRRVLATQKTILAFIVLLFVSWLMFFGGE